MILDYEVYLKGEYRNLDFVKEHAQSNCDQVILIYLCMLNSGRFVPLVSLSAFLYTRAEQFSDVAKKAQINLQMVYKGLFNEIKSCLKPEFSADFFECVEALASENPSSEKAIAGLKALSLKKNREGFYSTLILTHCYSVGLGVVSSEEEKLTYLERLIALSKEFKEGECDQVKVSILVQQQKTRPNTLSAYRIDFAKLLLSLEPGMMENVWQGFEEYHRSMSKLKGEISDNLASVEKNKSDNELEIKLRQLLTKLQEAELHYKLDFFKYGLKRALLGKREHVNSIYKYVLENKGLLIQAKETSLWEMLETLSDEYYNSVENENATRLYVLHLEFTSSPATAIRLASMAVDGRYIIPDVQGKLQGTRVSQPDYPRAAQYYDQAIRYAFERFDFAAASDAIKSYLIIEQNVPVQSRLNIGAKIQNYLASFSFSHLEDGSRNARPKFLIKGTKDKKADSPYSFIGITAFQLIDILLEQPFAEQNIARLRGAFLHALPKGHSEWFAVVANQLGARSSCDPVFMAIGDSLVALLPSITQNMLEKNAIDLDEIQKLLEAVSIIDLHRRGFKPVTDFLDGIEQCLAKCLITAGMTCNVENLEKIGEIYQVSKKINRNNEKYIDHSDECTYWLDRSNLENKFDLPVKSGGLNDIYRLVELEKNGKRPWRLLEYPYVEQLKAKGHPEAFLKLAQLLILKVQSSSTEAILNEIGINLIKAAGCIIPQDKSGIYKGLCFNTLSILKKKVDEDPFFSVKQRAIVHFYYALGLLIFDKKRFDDQKTALFKEQNYQVTVPSMLLLFKDSKFEFTNAVRHHVISLIVGIRNMLDESTASEAVNLLKFTPPDNSIVRGLEGENFVLQRQVEDYQRQIAELAKLLKERDNQIKQRKEQLSGIYDVPTHTVKLS